MKPFSNIPDILVRGLHAAVVACLVALLALGVLGTPSPAFAEDAQLLCLPDDPTREEDAEPAPPPSPERAALLSQFQEPNLTPAETAAVLQTYTFVDPGKVIPRKLLERALVYFDVNKRFIPKHHVLTVLDFSRESRLPRFHMISMKTGEVVSIRVAHGTGSDPNNTGKAVAFSNEPGSHKSSLGAYLTAETYNGQDGDIRCRLDGLSATNSNVRPRAIVIHQADYVRDENIKPGRSWGCPAVSVENHKRVVNELKEGSIIYAGLP